MRHVLKDVKVATVSVALGIGLAGCDGAALTDENGNPQPIQVEITIGGGASSSAPAQASSSESNQSSTWQSSDSNQSFLWSSSESYSSVASVIASASVGYSSDWPFSSQGSSDDWLPPSSAPSSFAPSSAAYSSFTFSSFPFTSSSSLTYSSSISSGVNSSLHEGVPYPETPSRIGLNYNLATSWNLTIDTWVSDPYSPMAFALDYGASKVHQLNLTLGDMGGEITLPDDVAAIDLIPSEQMLVSISRAVPTLTLVNSSDLSVIDSIALNEIPHDLAISNNGLVAISFETGQAEVAIYDAVAGVFLESVAASLNSDVTFVGQQLFVSNANEPNQLSAFVLDPSGLYVRVEKTYPDIELGKIAASAESSPLIITENGHLIDRATLSLIDSINYGQTVFKDVKFLKDARFAMSLDETNYVRLFDARPQADSFNSDPDSRRIGSNSSLQPTAQVTAIATYDDTAFAIISSPWASHNGYSLVQMVLDPYLTSERRLAENAVASSSAVQSSSSSSRESNSSAASTEPSSQSSTQSNDWVYSSGASTTSVATSSAPFELQYPTYGLSIYESAPASKTWVDEERGIAYLQFDEAYSHIKAVDLSSGAIIGRNYGYNSRIEADFFEMSPDREEIWSYVSFDFNSSMPAKFFRVMANDSSLVNGAVTEFTVDEALAAMIVTDNYILGLDNSRTAIYQYTKNTGELMAQLDVTYVDDWLYLSGEQSLFTNTQGVVTEYKLDSRFIYASGFSNSMKRATQYLGWVNSDETRLYHSACEVYELPSFTLTDICPTSDDRRKFIDIAFGEGNTHFSLESYQFEGRGDVFITSLADYQFETTSLMGFHIFNTEAGAYVYDFENGKHSISQIASPAPVSHPVIDEPPRLTQLQPDGRYFSDALYWNMERYTTSWDTLLLQFTGAAYEPLVGGGLLRISPICSVRGCVKGEYVQSLSTVYAAGTQYTVALADYFEIVDERYFQGFSVSTPNLFSAHTLAGFVVDPVLKSAQ